MVTGFIITKSKGKLDKFSWALFLGYIILIPVFSFLLTGSVEIIQSLKYFVLGYTLPVTGYLFIGILSILLILSADSLHWFIQNQKLKSQQIISTPEMNLEEPVVHHTVIKKVNHQTQTIIPAIGAEQPATEQAKEDQAVNDVIRQQALLDQNLPDPAKGNKKFDRDGYKDFMAVHGDSLEHLTKTKTKKP